MPHLHLSLQAGDDMILKRMKRRHLRADAIDLCDRLRAARPEIAIGADFIAGFPTETDAMFANTLAVLDEAQIDYVHAFPYSPRPGIDHYRPKPETAWPRVFLAGDWTATGWPATMEGAVRSGYLAAESLTRLAGSTNASFLVPDLAPSGLMKLFR